MSGLRLSDLNKETTYLLTYLLTLFPSYSESMVKLSYLTRQVMPVFNAIVSVNT